MSKYLDMLEKRDTVPLTDELLVHACRWTLLVLAGFLLLPGTFADLQKQADGRWSQTLTHVQESMLILGWLFSGMSVFGLIWCWRKWRQNYVWLLDSIWIPTLFYSLAGMTSAISNIFGSDWKFTGTGTSALVVASAAIPVCTLGTAVYLFLLWRVRREHKRWYREFRANFPADAPYGGLTQYDHMLLQNQEISVVSVWWPRLFTWMLLAGFVMLPGTFETELQDSAVPKIPLFTSAWVFAGLGALGICWSIWRHRTNYAFLSQHVFIQGFEHAAMGLITTLATLYGIHNGLFTPVSRSTLIVTSAVALLCAAMAIACWRLKIRVQRGHDIAKQAKADEEKASDSESK